MNKDEIFLYEKEKLKQVIETINKQIEKAKDNFKKQEHFIIGFKEGQRGTQFIRQGLMSLYATDIYNLESSLSSPYFGMFEFHDSTTKEDKPIYIGKRAIMDDNNEIIAYDWRTPICSMYYDYDIGSAEYTINDTKKTGNINTKRHITIRNSELLSVEEYDVLSNDTILLKYLSENADSRLKSIIATIQKEQNKIIRSPLRKDYIIQGVAGSGKTTVALHRIAYLLYNEARDINESEFMILGPNKYFLNYISELLPDLDIKNVRQSTFDEIALSFMKKKVKLESKNTTLQNVLNGSANSDIIEYKSSIQFVKLLENFIDMYIQSHLNEPIIFEGIVICSPEKLKRIYENSFKSNKSYSEKINDFSKALVKSVKENSDDLCHLIWEQYRDEFKTLDKQDPRRKEILDKTNRIQTEIKKGCTMQIKDYFKFAKVDPLILYRTFIETLDKINFEFPVDVKELQNYTIKKLEKKQIGFEDLSPLLVINYSMNGIKDYEQFSHIVIDEAQDLSLAQYYILKKLFPKSNFDIFGDVNQSIYDYQSVHNWEELNTIIFDSKAILLDLNKSYRTTMEISDTANLVLNNINYNSSECIARSGREISVNSVDNETSVFTIINQIKQLLDKKYETIAIICKDDIETDHVYKCLTKYGLNINKISEQNDEYHGGLCIMPSYLSKGLEFDSVIIYNANDVVYTDKNIDMKLLYVAITRAMHELYINYNGTLTNALQSLERKQENAKLVKTKK